LAEGAKLKTLFVYGFERFTQFKSVLLMFRLLNPALKALPTVTCGIKWRKMPGYTSQVEVL
jgi:hypothetical protein